MADEWMRNEVVAGRYGFTPGEPFSSRFGAASVENILFYVFAVAVWAVESLVGLHKEEVERRIDELLPHRPKWYRDKVLEFIPDRELVGDSDEYDLSGMSDEELEAARVVKHAVAVESRDSSLLTIKVAGESDGGRRPLDAGHERQLLAYISEIKDAGVRIALVNQRGDVFGCVVDVYYNPMLFPSGVETACREAIAGYVSSLPFNGEYTNMALVDAIQDVAGVKIVEFKSSSATVWGESTPTNIDARFTPAAGYFVPGDITVNMIPYDSPA